jgi:transmembrane sensor
MKPADSSPRVASPDAIEETAANWLARRYGGFSAEESAAFETWLAADPRHPSAIADLENAWRMVSAPGRAGQGDIARERSRVRERHRTRMRRRATIATLSLAAAVLLGIAFNSSRWFSREAATALRIAVRPDVQHLPDGSTVQLNAGAMVEPSFTPDIRLIRLVRGEALFTVAKDANRPFVVSVGGVEVRAVGTAFNVRYDPTQVHVLVTEGKVAIARAGVSPPPLAAAPARPADPVILTAGNRTVIPLEPDLSPDVAPVTPAQIATALAWRDRRIEFTRTPLKEAVELFNRQNELQLAVSDQKTGSFEISGIFWADDPASFVHLLETAFEMTTEWSGRRVVVRKR